MQIYPKALRKLNIRTRLVVVSLLGIILFSSALLYLSKLISQSLVESYFYNYLETTQQEMQKSVELYITEINMLTVRLLRNDDVYALIEDTTVSHDMKEKRLRRILDEMSIDRQIIGDIVVATDKKEIFSYLGDEKLIERPDDLYIKDTIQSQKLITWGPVKKDADNNAYILLGKKYQNFYTGQKLGCLIIYIKETAFFDIYKKITTDMGYTFLVSGNGYVVSHPDKNKVGNTIFEKDMFHIDKGFDHYIANYEGEKSIFAISRFGGTLQSIGCDWQTVSIISQEKLFERFEKINLYVLIIGTVMSLITILILTQISFKITEPIQLLKSKLKEFGKNNTIKLSFIKKNEDEIWELEKSYNEMISRISDLIMKNNEEKEKQRKLELTALQAQINPHFLYNTLDAIGWIAKIKKQEDIEKLIMALASFFRLSLHKGDKYITLQEEVELVQNFLTIEQIRFPDKFLVEYNIEEDIKPCKILKLVLQPVVENAIKHGISMKRGKGLIKINAYSAGDGVELEVIDDGVGFDVSKLSENDPGEYRSGRYGLHNVDERIRLEYGQQYGMSIFSQKGEGTRVVIRLKAEFSSPGSN